MISTAMANMSVITLDSRTFFIFLFCFVYFLFGGVHRSVFPWTEMCTSHTVAPKIAGPDRGQKHILHTPLHQITLNSLAFFPEYALALDHIKSPVQTIVCSAFQNNQFRIVVTVFFKYSVSNRGDRVFQVFSLKSW